MPPVWDIWTGFAVSIPTLLFLACSDDETIGLVQEIYGTKVNKGICCVFCYNNLPAKNVLSEYVCDYKKRAGLFQRSADLE